MKTLKGRWWVSVCAGLLILAAYGCDNIDSTVSTIETSGAMASIDSDKLRVEIVYSGTGTLGSEWSLERLRELVDKIKTDRRINRLRIDGPHVTNDVVEIVSSLSHLQRLDMAVSSIDDKGLQSLCRLTELSSLNVSDCYNISADGLAELECLPHLKELDVSGIGLRSLRGIGRLRTLQSLIVGSVNLPGREWSELRELRLLTKLILNADEIRKEEVQVLTELTRLEVVTISCNRLPDPSCLVNLCSLPALRILEIFPPSELPAEVLDSIRKRRPDVRVSSYVP